MFEIDFQDEGADSVVIPTASYDSVIERDTNRYRERDNKDQSGAQGIYPNSVDSLHKSISCPSSMFRMPTGSSDYCDSSGYFTSSRPGQLPAHCSDAEFIDNYGRPTTAGAINIKTGASVISLDFPTSNLNKSTASSKKLSNQRSKKAKGSKRPAKDKKPKKLVKDIPSSHDGIGCFSEALCITPIPSLEQDDGYDRSVSPFEDEEDVFDVKPDPMLYQEEGRMTKSVYKFEKLAYPDLCGAKSPFEIEPLYHRKFGVQRYVSLFVHFAKLIYSFIPF